MRLSRRARQLKRSSRNSQGVVNHAVILVVEERRRLRNNRGRVEHGDARAEHAERAARRQYRMPADRLNERKRRKKCKKALHSIKFSIDGQIDRLAGASEQGRILGGQWIIETIEKTVTTGSSLVPFRIACS
jgi:hypothetical protein